MQVVWMRGGEGVGTDQLLAALHNISGPDGNGNYKALCPYHDENMPSFSVRLDKGFKCFGCGRQGSIRSLCEHLGVAYVGKSSYQGNGGSRSAAKVLKETFYNYPGDGAPLQYQFVRLDYEDKTKRTWYRRPDGNGGWIKNLDGIATCLYQRIAVLAAETVILVEGEKCAERINSVLHELGLYGRIVATTNPMGAGKWRTSYSKDLQGKIVWLLLDNDEAGEKHGEVVAPSVAKSAKYVKVIRLPGLIYGEDVFDFLEAGGTFKRIEEIVREAPEWHPPKPTLTSPSQFSLDEIGNGKRFASRFAEDMRYCTVRGEWMLYAAGRWGLVQHGEAEQRARAIRDAVAAEAAAEPDDGKKAQLLKHASSLTKRSARETMLKDAASEPGIAVTPEEFDNDPRLFNVANGTLDLRNPIRFLPHSSVHLLSMQSPVKYDPSATCPTWNACMERWLPDLKAREYVQDTVGASLLGVSVDEYFNFLAGDGDNGKSTFMRRVEKIFGDYWHKTQAETIMTARDIRRAGAASPELLALKGARLVTVQEIDSKHQINATLVKDLTGRDALTARGLFEKRETTFVPQFTLWMFGNGKPRIEDTSGGMWRRVRLINFGPPIPKSERDPAMGEKLDAEMSGILNWALEGLSRVLQRGLMVPDSIAKAVEEYKSDEDVYAGFISDQCIVAENATVLAKDIFAAYTIWCLDNNEKNVGTQKSFGVELTRRGFHRIKNNGKRGWRGIALKTNDSESESAFQNEDDDRVPRVPFDANPHNFPIENFSRKDFVENGSLGTLGTLSQTEVV